MRPRSRPSVGFCGDGGCGSGTPCGYDVRSTNAGTVSCSITCWCPCSSTSPTFRAYVTGVYCNCQLGCSSGTVCQGTLACSYLCP